MCVRKGTEGSNPSLSAIFKRGSRNYGLGEVVGDASTEPPDDPDSSEPDHDEEEISIPRFVRWKGF